MSRRDEELTKSIPTILKTISTFLDNMIATRLLSLFFAALFLGHRVSGEDFTKTIVHIGDRTRRLQSKCAAELADIKDCLGSSGRSCAMCLDENFNRIIAPESVKCTDFESGMCQAIYEDCTYCSSWCRPKAEALYHCIATTSGCNRFECNPPVPTDPTTTTTTTTTTRPTRDTFPEPASCGMSEFKSYCEDTHGYGARAACIVM